MNCQQCRSELPDEGQFCPFCGVPRPAAPSEWRIVSDAEVDLGWGKVVVGKVLGEGGMGVVHRAWLYYNPDGSQAGTPPHPVAVKVLHPSLRGRERARTLFLGEATALSRLSHPNIVHFFELVQRDGQLAIVMELVEGQALHEIIGRRARSQKEGQPVLPFARAWHYFSQMLGALAAIHSMGIIHRDIKPANVLVRHDGVVKLTDFGIARVPMDQARNTGSMAPGTGAYMSPEAVMGLELDGRSDLYGAAIVLFEMLTARTPFDAPDRNELMVRTAQIEEPPPSISSLIPSAPPVLDMLVARALAKDRMHRFGSAIEMGEAFRDALGLPESAGWHAQQRLAANARAISQALPAKTGTAAMPRAQAEKLRTEVEAAYRS